MIYTITLNPSLDYLVEVENLELGMTNRTKKESTFPGGKGINVSMVLHNLGFENTALGFLAGFVGAEIEKRVKDCGITTDFIHLKEGNSRINVKIQNVDGTEINGMGPEISEDALNTLKNKLAKLTKGDVLVLAGSIPKSIPDSIYKEIMKALENQGVMVVVDATRALLINVLEHHPFLVKPNHHELGEIFGVKITTREEACVYAKKLRELGAVNVLVSMGGMGAVLVDENGKVHEKEAPKGNVIHTVGSGDSMVAGFLAGWLKYHSYEVAFQTGIAAGSASAFSEGLATKAEINSFIEKEFYF